MKNYKQQFQSWLIKKYGDTGTPSSYIKAVDILDEKLDMKIFTLVDTKYLKSLYKDLIKNQGNPNDKYFDINRPSYGSRGFYSASIKSYIEFLDEYDIGENLLSYIISSIQNAGGQATLQYIYKSVKVLSNLNDIDYSQYYKNEESYTGQIRKTIYLHSSDCDIYKSSNPDIFIAPEEKGMGLWALRNTESEEETEYEIHIRKNAAITGKKAEELFEIYANEQLKWNVQNFADKHGYGYDFLCEDENGNELFIEVKGCKDEINSIRMTKNEWNVSKENGDKYILYIVSKIYSDKPIFSKYINPFKLFKNKAEEKEVKSITMHIKKNDLI